MRGRRGWRRHLEFVLLCLVMTVGLAPAAAGAERRLDVEVMSSRADAVSGGDALVRVVPSSGVAPGQVRVSVDGEDVTGDFRVRGGNLVGLVDEVVGSVHGPSTVSEYPRLTHTGVGALFATFRG